MLLGLCAVPDAGSYRLFVFMQCAQNTLITRARLAQMANETSNLNQILSKISDAFLKANQAKETAQKEVKSLEAEKVKFEENFRLMGDEIVNLKEELKDQEAEIIVMVQVVIANKVLLGKLDKKALQGFFDEYMQVGCIKDFESKEDKKDDAAGTVQSTADSGSTTVQKETSELAAPVEAFGDQA